MINNCFVIIHVASFSVTEIFVLISVASYIGNCLHECDRSFYRVKLANGVFC